MYYYNKFDYSLAGGLEIHRFKGLLIGGRYNLSLAELYKDMGTGFTGTITSFKREVNVKNNVVTHRIPRRE